MTFKTIKELEAELDCQYPKADDKTFGYYHALKDVLGLFDKRIDKLRDGCNEPMPYNKCGEIKLNYFNGKKPEPIYCLRCKALIEEFEELKKRILG